jgi:hypothetical protein
MKNFGNENQSTKKKMKREGFILTSCRIRD